MSVDINMDKMIKHLKARSVKLSSFISKIEKKVLKLPDLKNLEPGSEEHMEYLNLYLKFIRAYENVAESARRAISSMKEAEKSNFRELDELYSLLRALRPEERAMLKEAYYKLKGVSAIDSNAMDSTTSQRLQ